MGLLLDKFEKLIVEHGSAVVRGDLIALLREQLQIAEKRMTALETENSSLTAANHTLKTENQRLKDELHRKSHTTELDTPKLQIMKVLAERGGAYATDLEHLLQLHRTHIDHHLNELIKAGYVKQSRRRIGHPTVYTLSPKGKEYAVLNNFV